MTSLDITDWSERGQDLHIAIVLAVSEYSQTLTQTLPGILKITKAQYKILLPNPEMQPMWESKDFLYRTPLNCMEVVVV